MKITKSDLKQIIKEEVVKLLTENEDQENAIKILRLLSGRDPDHFAQGIEFYSLFKGEIEANAPTENDQILAKLKIIDQFAGSDIQDVSFLSGLSELNVTEKINLRYCSSLQNVDGLQGLTNLTYLSLYWCSSLQNVDGLQGLTNLTKLVLDQCGSLENVDGLEGCTNLTSLSLYGCESLENVDGLQGLTNLNWVGLYGCKSLQNVDGLEGLTNLTSLSLYGCESLQNVDALQGLTNLTRLSLYKCTSLPPELQQWFESDGSGTAHEKFMKALNAFKGNQP